MKFFYIPDGHRRYALRERVSLMQAYEIGYRVLIEEVIYPLFAQGVTTDVGIFLLSSLNLKRRIEPDLTQLTSALDRLIPRLREELAPICSVHICGPRNQYLADPETESLRKLFLFVESDTQDQSPMGEVDLFIRSGGALRLSGAPRSLIGPYTEMVSISSLHPDIRQYQVLAAVAAFEQRYMAEEARDISEQQLLLPTH